MEKIIKVLGESEEERGRQVLCHAECDTPTQPQDSEVGVFLGVCDFTGAL